MSQLIPTSPPKTSDEVEGPRHLSRRSLITLTVTSIVSGALLLVLLARLISAGNTLATAPAFPLIGHAAPDFSLSVWNPGNGSKTIHLADLKGHPVVVNFWASWCDGCQEEQLVLSAAFAKYQSQGVVFLGIAYQDHQPDGTAFLAKWGVTYPCGVSNGDSVPTDYSVTGPPETVFIGRDGKVVSKTVGMIDDGSLDRAIQGLLH